MAVYTVSSDRRKSHAPVHKRKLTEEQKNFKKYLRTHTVEIIGYNEEGTPIARIVPK